MRISKDICAVVFQKNANIQRPTLNLQHRTKEVEKEDRCRRDRMFATGGNGLLMRAALLVGMFRNLL